MSERIIVYDRVKGFAILCVLIGHVIIGNTFGRREHGGADVWMGIISAFNMPLFMFVSGLLSKFPLPVVVFFRRFSRLFIPATIFGFAYAFLVGDEISFSLFGNFKQGSWYLYVLCIFTIFQFVFFNFEMRGRKGFTIDILIFVFIWAFLMLFFHQNILNDNVKSILYIEKCVRLWPAFGIGMLISRHNLLYQLFNSNNKFTFTICFLAISKFFAMRTTGYTFDIINGIYNFSFIYIIVYLFMKRKNEKNNYWEDKLCLFGENSLYIFIYHFFILRLIHLKPIGFWLFETNNIILELVIATAISIPVSYICIYIAKLIRQSSLISRTLFGELF